MTGKEQNQNNDAEGQSAKNDLSVFEGISPETVEALRSQEPWLFGEEPKQAGPDDPEAAGKPADGAEDPEKKKEAAVAEGDADGGSGRPEQAGNEKHVPVAALHEERARRKELQDRLDRREREFQEMARMQLEQARSLQQSQTRAQPPEPVDPLTQLVEQKLLERLKPIEEQAARKAAMQDNEVRISRFEAEAKQKYADYDEVVAPVMNWMTEQAQKASQGDQRAVAGLGFVLGQANPAEAAYTMGIRLKYEQQAKAAQAGATPQGAPAAVAAGNIPPTPAEQKAAAEKAQAAINHPRGLDLGSGGGGGDKILTEADLANMTSDEWAKLPVDKRKKLLGGQL